METPTISKKQAKNTLSGKKKKTEVIKNVLSKPYQNYWPLVSEEDNAQLTENLERILPRIMPIKLNVPYKEIKHVQKQERKHFRLSYNKHSETEVNKAEREYLVFGINSVSSLLEKQEAGSVLIAGDVQPRHLVQHILDQAVLHSVPILVLHNLRATCKNKCGVSGAVVALKKSVNADSKLGLVQQMISNIWENYPVPENHINYHRKLDVSTITIPDSEDNTSVCAIENSDQNKNFHLTKDTGKKRVFVPSSQEAEKSAIFIDLDSSSLATPVSNKKRKKHMEYHSLSVKRVKGDKNRNQRKMEKFKRKKHKNTNKSV